MAVRGFSILQSEGRGFEYAPLARVGLASEGSFGPHPHIPSLAVGRELRIMGLTCVVSPYGRTAGQMTAVKLGFKNVSASVIKAGRTVVLTGTLFGTLSYKLHDDLQPNDQFSVWDFPIAQKPTSCAASAR